MKFTLIALSLILSIAFFNCKNSNTNQKEAKNKPFESAMPHSASLPHTELSASDKQKLANARGKSMIPISKNDLDSMLMYSDDILHVYSFFKADDNSCKIVNDALLDLQKEVGDTTFRLIFFSLDGMENIKEINSAIRENGVTSDVFYSSDLIDLDWYSKISSNWTGKVPAVFLLNKTDGTQLFYQKNFGPEELSALIHPFIM